MVFCMRGPPLRPAVPQTATTIRRAATTSPPSSHPPAAKRRSDRSAAAAAIAIEDVQTLPEEDLAEIDEGLEQVPTEQEMPQTEEDEESWGKLRRACRKLKLIYSAYGHLASVSRKLKVGVSKRYHGRTLRSWCKLAGTPLQF